MEALLAEKAALAQENDRLLREKAGLQELLEFTILQQVAEVGDDELFSGYDEEETLEVAEDQEGEGSVVEITGHAGWA